MNSNNICLYGAFGIASVLLGVGGLIVGSKVLAGAGLVSTAALVIFALVQNSKGAGEEQPLAKQKTVSYALPLLTGAAILGSGITGMVLSSNALIISALVFAVILVVQSDIASQRIAIDAHKVLAQMHKVLQETGDELQGPTANQVELTSSLSALLAILKQPVKRVDI